MTKNKEIKTSLNRINKEIYERQGKIKEFKDELDKLHETSKNKHPEIDGLNSRIQVLKDQKKAQLELREERRGEVHALEVEFKKMEQEILVAKDQEGKKDEIKAAMGKLDQQVRELRNSMAQFSKDVFVQLIDEVEQVKKTNNFYLSADLVGELVKHRITLPRDRETADKTIDQLKQNYDNADSMFSSKREAINLKIKEINDEKAELKKKLDEMPESDLELLKKGGYFREKSRRA